MNAKVTWTLSNRGRHIRIPAVTIGLYFTFLIMASSFRFASAQADMTELKDTNPAARHLVSVNQLLTPEKARKALEKAKDAILRGRYEDAQNQLKRALDIFPDCAIAFALQGLIKEESGDIPEAAHSFQQAIDADPSLGAAYLGLGQSYNLQHRYSEAQIPLDRATALMPSAWLVHVEAATAKLGTRDSDAGLKELALAEQFIEDDPNARSEVAYLQGVAHQQLKDYVQAKGDLEKSIKYDRGGRYAPLARKAMDELSKYLGRTETTSQASTSK
jgi:tetratricopeptide (TPR) repeat protein